MNFVVPPELLAVERLDGKMTKADRDLLKSHMQQQYLGRNKTILQTITSRLYYEDKSEALEQLPDNAEWISEFNIEVDRPDTTWRIDITFYAF